MTLQPRHIPNCISLARLLATPLLLWLAARGQQDLFAWGLLLAGCSDILDGWLARRYGWTSAFGAMLDSIADVVLTLTAIVGLWVFFRQTLAEYWVYIAAVCLAWLAVHVAALLRYRRLASFHTRFTQISLFSFGAFVITLFFYEFVEGFFFLVVAFCVLAGIENLVMILLLDKWRPNLRGGLYTLLKGDVPGARTTPETESCDGP